MIYGSSDKAEFIKLKNLNKFSDTDSISMLLLGEETFDIHKIHHLSKKSKNIKIGKKFHYFYGISEKLNSMAFEPTLMSPFVYENWVVAFDGIIYNKNNIFENNIEYDYTIDDNNSSFLTYILNHLYTIGKSNEVIEICKAFSLIEGVYSSWVFNIETRNGFLAKCNTDLFADIYTNSFSTENVKGFEPLQDGEVYQLTKEGITTVGYFNCSFC